MPGPLESFVFILTLTIPLLGNANFSIRDIMYWGGGGGGGMSHVRGWGVFLVKHEGGNCLIIFLWEVLHEGGVPENGCCFS